MGEWISLIVFVGTCLLILLAFALHGRDTRRMVARVRNLGEGAAGPPPGMRTNPLLARLSVLGLMRGGSKAEQDRMRERFAHAGIYTSNAVSLFLGVKTLLASTGVVLGLALALCQVLSASRGLLAGLTLAALGLLVPGIWLEAQVRKWQSCLRRGLPDAMDMLVLCLEGGVSLVAALQYVTKELRKAHPELGSEMEILQHEMALGKTAGESMQKFGQRCGLEEVRTLASVLLQNERYGVSVARALRVHADAMRQHRALRAEEMAQKAAVKILFPTLLCIFPAVFIVVLGPAAFRIMAIFARMR